MRIRDQTTVWLTTRTTETNDGETNAKYTNLRAIWLNVQYMSNVEQQRVYGTITDTVIALRRDYPADIKIGDHVYMIQPLPNADGTYPKGDYVIESVQTAYVGTQNRKNPLIAYAKKVHP